MSSDASVAALKRDAKTAHKQCVAMAQEAGGSLDKAYLALATVEADFAQVGTEVDVEVTVEYRRAPCRAVVRPRPFFDPERKKA